MINKVSGLLGISSKAGKIICGMDSVLEDIYKKSKTCYSCTEMHQKKQ